MFYVRKVVHRIIINAISMLEVIDLREKSDTFDWLESTSDLHRSVRELDHEIIKMLSARDKGEA